MVKECELHCQQCIHCNFLETFDTCHGGLCSALRKVLCVSVMAALCTLSTRWQGAVRYIENTRSRQSITSSGISCVLV